MNVKRIAYVLGDALTGLGCFVLAGLAFVVFLLGARDVLFLLGVLP